MTAVWGRAPWLTEMRPCTPRIVGLGPFGIGRFSADIVMAHISWMSIIRSVFNRSAEPQPGSLRESDHWGQRCCRALSITQGDSVVAKWELAYKNQRKEYSEELSDCMQIPIATNM